MKSVKTAKKAAPSTDRIIGIASKTLAQLLESYAELAFDFEKNDIGSTRGKFRAWAQHVLTGAPVDGRGDANGDRDWKGLLKEFTLHRQAESRYVVRGLRDLRDLLWSFSHLACSELTEESRAAREVDGQMVRLEAAIAGDSLDNLKSQAGETIKLVTRIGEQRRKRQKSMLNELGKRLRTLQDELEQARKDLEVDGLTQLYNRKALDAHIEKISEISVYTGSPVALLMIDIDHFKKVNDENGHPAGDAVIVEVARRTLESFPRKADFVARYGGEEFCVVLQDVKLDVAAKLALRLIEKLRKSVVSHEGKDGAAQIAITISVGATALAAGEDPRVALKRADAALYEAKKNGRDRLVVG